MAVLTKGSTGASSPVEPLQTRVLLAVLACSVVVLVTVTLLMHWQVTSRFDDAVVNRVGTTRGSLAAHAAMAVTSLGDTVPC